MLNLPPAWHWRGILHNPILPLQLRAIALPQPQRIPPQQSHHHGEMIE
jgi:hypothetical protein